LAGPDPARLASQQLDGFIGDGPGAYNASLLPAAAKPEPLIVNVNIAKARIPAEGSPVLRSECAQINV
jgi:hypothetical protein